MLDACGLDSGSEKEAEMKSMQNSTVAGSAMQGVTGAFLSASLSRRVQTEVSTLTTARALDWAIVLKSFEPLWIPHGHCPGVMVQQCSSWVL